MFSHNSRIQLFQPIFHLDLGFKLDCQLHQVIVARFADEQLIIDFDNFVRCLIRLETLFSKYLSNNFFINLNNEFVTQFHQPNSKSYF